MTMWSRNLTYSLILAIQLLWVKLSFIHASNPPRRNILVRKPLKQDNQQEGLFSSKRKACGFYVWHVVSAGLHGLCQHLCKNCKYEGRGGREFMLIPPGSLLQLLYPCDQYSPDACFWCGGNHADHVALAWSKTYLYSPFDLMLDRVKKEATTITEIKVWKEVPPDIKTTYGFHKRYVIDVDAPLENTKPDKEGKASYDTSRMFESRTFGIRYLLPRFSQSHVARQIVTFQLNRLIEIQQLENEVLDMKQHGEYSRNRRKLLKSQLQAMN